MKAWFLVFLPNEFPTSVQQGLGCNVYTIEQNSGKELTRMRMHCTYWDSVDSAWQLRPCNFGLEIFGFDLTIFIMIILLTTVYQYLIRETDLHKFYNLFLNPIEHCKYIYIYMCVVEWSRALDIRLSDWCCSVSMV